MFFTCLLTKDGISYAFDKLKENSEISLLTNMESEDSAEEEEGSSEDWLNHSSFMDLVPQLLVEKLINASFPERNESELNVLLEQVSPPPRMA
jgi:hypothetical protein